MSNRFNRGKQNFNQNPNFPSIKPPPPTTKPGTSTAPPRSSPPPHTKPKPFTSKQASKKKKNKKVTQIWVRKNETRNWLDLPRDITLHIFLKLGVADLLRYAQFVCSLWRDIARDPNLYRCIDFSDPFNEGVAPVRAITMDAINRSRGQLDDFSMVYNATDQMLLRMVETSCRLKRLRLAKCFQVSNGVLVEVVKKMPSLETVELCMWSFTTEVVEAVGRACPGLKSFRLNQQRLVVFSHLEVAERLDNEALAIANTMPGLQSLHLFGSRMTNNGLEAILEKCPHLEYLDLRKCSNVDVKGDLLTRCRQIKILKLPDDSTQDYEFGSDFDEIGDYESDFSYDGDYASDFSYDDFTDPFNPIYWCDDDDYNFIMGKDSDDDSDLGDQLF